MTIPDYAKTALKIIQDNAGEAYLVGGCVRDMVMGKAQNDIDITTNMLPDKIEELFSHYKTLDIGKKHGTITVFIDGNSVEITTYRVESEYGDNRHPDKVSFNATLLDDLSRRDFTMNAICYNDNCGFVDEFNGIDDIKNKLIRAIGEPKKRFDEDALRILRAFRFMSQFDFTIEENTKSAIYYCKDLLLNISVERITSELSKLIVGDNALNTLSLMNELCVLKDIIKPLEESDKSAFRASKASLTLRAAIALTQNGIDSLCFESRQKELIKNLILHKSDFINADKVSIKKSLRVSSYEELSLLLEYKSLYGENVLEQQKLLYEIIKNDECYSLKQLEVNGDDIIKCGIPQGTEVGKALNLLLDKVIYGEIPNNKNALIEYIL